HLVAREVLVAIIDGFEFTAIDGDAGLCQEPKLAAQLDELSTDLTDGGSVVLAEIRDDFVIGNETAQEPHHFEVTARFASKAPARRHPVDIAVDVELEQYGGVINRKPRFPRWYPHQDKTHHVQRPPTSAGRTGPVVSPR